MANTIAKATGIDKTRRKDTVRLGSVAAETVAATWRTFVRVRVNVDGSGHVLVTRDDMTIYRFDLLPEEEND